MLKSVSTKLSRHVLGMKFMRKTKDQADKVKTEKKFRKHFAAKKEVPFPTDSSRSSSQAVPNAHPPSATLSEALSSSQCVIEEVGSYSQCERHIFGRQSYGGFNPVLEANIRKGLWRPFYMDPVIDGSADDLGNGSEYAEEQKRLKDEQDISDEELAKTYGSLVATLGKKFGKGRNARNKDKRQNQGRPNKRIKLDSDQLMDSGGTASMSRKNKKQASRAKQRLNVRNNGSPNGNNDADFTRTSPQDQSKNEGTGPKNKKRKFMKPSEDD